MTTLWELKMKINLNLLNNKNEDRKFVDSWGKKSSYIFQIPTPWQSSQHFCMRKAFIIISQWINYSSWVSLFAILAFVFLLKYYDIWSSSFRLLSSSFSHTRHTHPLHTFLVRLLRWEIRKQSSLVSFCDILEHHHRVGTSSGASKERKNLSKLHLRQQQQQVECDDRRRDPLIVNKSHIRVARTWWRRSTTWANINIVSESSSDILSSFHLSNVHIHSSCHHPN